MSFRPTNKPNDALMGILLVINLVFCIFLWYQLSSWKAEEKREKAFQERLDQYEEKFNSFVKDFQKGPGEKVLKKTAPGYRDFWTKIYKKEPRRLQSHFEKILKKALHKKNKDLENRKGYEIAYLLWKKTQIENRKRRTPTITVRRHISYDRHSNYDREFVLDDPNLGTAKVGISLENHLSSQYINLVEKIVKRESSPDPKRRILKYKLLEPIEYFYFINENFHKAWKKGLEDPTLEVKAHCYKAHKRLLKTLKKKRERVGGYYPRQRFQEHHKRLIEIMDKRLEEEKKELIREGWLVQDLEK